MNKWTVIIIKMIFCVWLTLFRQCVKKNLVLMLTTSKCFYYIHSFWVYLFVCVWYLYMCIEVRGLAYRSSFSLSTVWVSRMELISSVLVASSLTHGAISLVYLWTLTAFILKESNQGLRDVKSGSWGCVAGKWCSQHLNLNLFALVLWPSMRPVVLRNDFVPLLGDSW